MKRYPFRIPIGDWSDDGHGKCDWYDATAAKPVDAVREAWFAAKERVPAACHPDTFCDLYEEYEVPDDVREALTAEGAPCPEDWNSFGTEDMARVVVWFVNQGDPQLDARLDGEEPPMLPFYGNDERGRHIEGIGYGMLG